MPVLGHCRALALAAGGGSGGPAPWPWHWAWQWSSGGPGGQLGPSGTGTQAVAPLCQNRVKCQGKRWVPPGPKASASVQLTYFSSAASGERAGCRPGMRASGPAQPEFTARTAVVVLAALLLGIALSSVFSSSAFAAHLSAPERALTCSHVVAAAAPAAAAPAAAAPGAGKGREGQPAQQPAQRSRRLHSLTPRPGPGPPPA